MHARHQFILTYVTIRRSIRSYICNYNIPVLCSYIRIQENCVANTDDMEESNDSMELFRISPAVFQQVLIRFRVCHDLCLYTSKELLKPDTLTKIDQCAVDFRHMSIQTATLADRISSLWCKTCLLFFKNIDKVTNADKILNRISTQAKELSVGFKSIAKWCRELAGRFHEAQKLAQENSDEFQKMIDDAEKEANRLAVELESKLSSLETSAREKRGSVNTLIALTAIPLVGTFFGVAAIIKNEDAKSAEESVRSASKQSEEAKQKLLEATNRKDQAKVRKMYAKKPIRNYCTRLAIASYIHLMCRP